MSCQVAHIGPASGITNSFSSFNRVTRLLTMTYTKFGIIRALVSNYRFSLSIGNRLSCRKLIISVENNEDTRPCVESGSP